VKEKRARRVRVGPERALEMLETEVIEDIRNFDVRIAMGD